MKVMFHVGAGVVCAESTYRGETHRIRICRMQPPKMVSEDVFVFRISCIFLSDLSRLFSYSLFAVLETCHFFFSLLSSSVDLALSVSS